MAYLWHILGERPTLEQYLRDTQGCTAAGWPADYVTEIGKRALEAVAGQGVGWGPRTDQELTLVEQPIDLGNARGRVLEIAAAAEPALRALTGVTATFDVTIELADRSTDPYLRWQ